MRTTTALPDHYHLLGLPPTATLDEIRRRYRKLMMSGAHPDKGGDPEHAKRLNLAYEVLRDPVARSRYDSQRGHRSRGTTGAGPGGASRPGPSPARYPSWWDDFAPPPPRRRPTPPPRPRLMRCTFCRTANRVPSERRFEEARCGSCGAGFAGSWRDSMAAKLRSGAALHRAGKLHEAMAVYHKVMKDWPENSVPYLEVARIFRAWGLEHQSQLHRELAERFGKVTFDGSDDAAA